MPVNLIIAFAVLFVLGVAGFALAWVAFTPTGDGQKVRQLELSLKRIEREAHSAQDLLVGAGGER